MLNTGDYLGAYRVLTQIGQGGMATVYKGYHPSTQRYVAIKVMPPYFAADEKLRARFINEAKVAASLEHAHIVPVHDFGEQDGLPYLVMRYLQAGTLKEVIERQGLPLSEVVHIIGQVASALDYAHRQGVVHRDVKPSNVLVDGEGNCYLSDFGIARMTEEAAHLTSTGVVGTPAYMSPEQADGQASDGRSDVYSLGVVLYQMLTGRVPFEATTPMALIAKHMNVEPPNPRSLNEGLSEELEAVILTAMAKKAEDRYQSMAAFSAALQKAAQVDGISASATLAGQAAIEIANQHAYTAVTMDALVEADRAARRKRGLPGWAYGLVTLGVVGIAALAVWLMFEQGGQSDPTEVAQAESTTLPTDQPTPTAGPTATSLPFYWQRLTSNSAIWFAVAQPSDLVIPLAASTDVLVDHLDRLVLYAGTEGAGIYKSTNGGESWTPAGVGLNHTSVIDLEMAFSNTRLILAATRDGGVYRSEDAGATWAQANSGVIQPTCIESRCALAIAPSDPNRAYLSSFDGTSGRVYASTDGGMTWTPVAENTTLRSMSVDAANPDLIYALSVQIDQVSEGGVWRSQDGGKSWQAAMNGIDGEASSFNEIVLTGSEEGNYLSPCTVLADPVRSGNVYAIASSATDGACAGVYASADSASTWTWIDSTAGGMALDPDTGKLFYVYFYLDSSGYAGQGWGLGSYFEGNRDRFLIGGIQETMLYNPSVNNLYLPLDPGKFYYYGRSRTPLAGIRIAIGGGPTSPTIQVSRGSGLSNFRPSLFFFNNNSAIHTLYVDSSGGSITDRDGIIWNVSRGGGLEVAGGIALNSEGVSSSAGRMCQGGQYNQQTGAVDPPGYCAFGVFDSSANFYPIPFIGLPIMNLPPERASEVPLSGNLWFHPQDSSIVAVSARPCATSVWQSMDGAYHWSTIELGSEVCNGHFASDKQGQALYIIGDTAVFRSDDQGASWQAVDAPAVIEGSIIASVINPLDGQELWVGTSGSGIFHSTDGGETWEQFNNGLGNLFINKLDIDSSTPTTLYAATNNGLYISLNGGESWGAVRQGLSASQIIYSVAVDPSDPERVFIATPDGIFQLVK